MVTLTIKIKGVALISMEREWKIYLPWDDCHKVVLRDPKHGIFDMNLSDANQRISVTVHNSNESRLPVPIPMPDPNSFINFFDITHPTVHKNGVVLKKNWADRTVLMTVPGGLYSASISDGTYSMYLGSVKVREIGPLGVEGTIRVQGEEIRLDVIGGGSPQFPIRYSEDTVIVIDNDCHAVGNNDFPMLYEHVLSEKTNPRFEITPDEGSAELPCNGYRVTKPLEVEK
jgi:hypothetical protein